MNITIGILLPFIGTTLGSALVYIMKNKIKNEIERFILGFASGVMIAASIWSLLIPAIEIEQAKGDIAWIYPSIGFASGIIFLLLIDMIVPYFKFNKETKLKRTTMLILAVTIHNIPEGMAVGAIFAGFLSGNAGITYAGAFALSLGIAIQNFPEGAIISMPLKSEGYKKTTSFIIGTLSGIVEPIAAVLTVLLTNILEPLMPFLLSLAAGAMIYVVSEELIPGANTQKQSSIGTIGVGIGFLIMMILDITLG